MAKKIDFGTFVFYVLLAIGLGLFLGSWLHSEFYEADKIVESYGVVQSYSVFVILHLVIGRILALFTILLDKINARLSAEDSDYVFHWDYSDGFKVGVWSPLLLVVTALLLIRVFFLVLYKSTA